MSPSDELVTSDKIYDECSPSCSRGDEVDSPASSSGEETSSEAPVTVPSASSGYVDISSDPKLVSHFIVSKFENLESEYLPPPGANEVEEGTSKTRKVSTPRKPRESRIPEVVGATLVTEKKLFDLRLDYFISEEVELRLPTSEERADSPPEGYFTFMLGYIELAYMWFPIPDIVVRFFWRHNLAFAQVTPQSFRHIVAFLVRSYEHNYHISSAEFRTFLKVSKGQRLNNHYISPQPGYKLITDHPTKDPYWEHYYFYVKLNEAAIEGDLNLVKTEWNWRGRVLLFRV